MHILVLDTIHGGDAIGRALTARGDTVDTVDVYRGTGGVSIKTAGSRTYDLIVAPVHLDPDHILLRTAHAPVISHHEAVRQLLDGNIPIPMIEITGTRGKTTTAHALASILPGRGILHTSSGTYRFPGKEWISRTSITPASVLHAAGLAREIGGWLVVEESLGVTGAGTLAIITSDEDYSFAAGKKLAVAAKMESARFSKQLLVAGNLRSGGSPGVVHLEDIVSSERTGCRVNIAGKEFRFSNSLLLLPSYRVPLELAAAAAAILGFDPTPLALFTALPGRMSTTRTGGILVVDNSNSGTNADTALDAMRYARALEGNPEITLVIGKAVGDGAVCEGFPPDQVLSVIRVANPQRIVWVGDLPGRETPGYRELEPLLTARAASLEEGYSLAKDNTHTGSIVLAVKTWR
ncbi:coenzyme F430 synthase [uncultured Methanoregula sp.]|uniref:coenzyme F430 synthase n=1 Tax=uncultured Methanoregula sp. TaxID=1005933 RepID=UPI002AAA6F16|nr:coenzyme F430 synthase [uncultured Methanoregula sp.]